MVLIVDTVALVCLLEHINHPKLIQDLRKTYGEIMIPYSVKEEFEVKSQALVEYIENNEIKITRNTTYNDIDSFMIKYPRLGRGESEVILSWQYFQRRGTHALCVLDDRYARKVAKVTNVDFTGMLGLLRMLEGSGFLSPGERRGMIKSLRDSGVYLSDEDRAEPNDQ